MKSWQRVLSMKFVKAKPTVYCHDMLLSNLEMEITVEISFFL